MPHFIYRLGSRCQCYKTSDEENVLWHLDLIGDGTGLKFAVRKIRDGVVVNHFAVGKIKRVVGDVIVRCVAANFFAVHFFSTFWLLHSTTNVLIDWTNANEGFLYATHFMIWLHYQMKIGSGWFFFLKIVKICLLQKKSVQRDTGRQNRSVKLDE